MGEEFSGFLRPSSWLVVFIQAVMDWNMDDMESENQLYTVLMPNDRLAATYNSQATGLKVSPDITTLLIDHWLTS